MFCNHVCTVGLLSKLFCRVGTNLGPNRVNLWESNLVDSELLTLYCTQMQIIYLLLCLHSTLL